MDPVLPDDKPLPLPPPRPKNTIFEDEEKSKMLARLLNSTHPEDLKAANKLIKEMVQEDQKRMEKVSKRVNTIAEVKSSVNLLTELLSSYTAETTSQSTEETIQELYQRCEKLRPTLFRLASDTEDNDEALAEILQANDSLTQVINAYKQVVRGEEVNGESVGASRIAGSSSALLDLTGLDTSLTTPTYPAFPSLSAGHWAPPPDAGHSLLDDELMSLGLNDPNPSSNAASQSLESTGWNSFQSSDTVEPAIPADPAAVLKPTAPSQAPPPAGPSSTQAPPPGSTGLDDLDLLGKTLLQQSLPPENMQVKWDKHLNQHKPSLRDLQHRTQTIDALPSTPSPSPASSQQTGALPNSQPSGGAPQPAREISLANVTVPLESIKPSSIPPVTVFDRHSFRVLFHFALDPPPARPDVLVVVISMISTAPVPVQNIVFQSAVPKVMKVKLQPPSGTELPAFNPVVPPAAITQVLLLANPHKVTEILQANDSLTQVINAYKQVVRGEEVNGESVGAARIAGSSSALLDLTGLDTSLTTPSYPAFPSLSAGHWAPPPDAGHSLLDDELMSLGLNDPNPSSKAASQSLESTGWNSFQSSDTVEPAIPADPAAVLKPTAPSQAPPPAGPSSTQAPPPGSTGLDDLDLLGKTLLQQSLPPENMQVKWDKHLNQHKPSLRDLQHRTQTVDALPSTPSPSPASSQQTGALPNSQPSGGAPQPAGEISLANVTVPLESIKPSSIPPVTVFDRHSFRVLFHFALDPPPARPDVLVVVISMISTAPVPVQNIVFQSAVPKVMKVKLQPPSGTELPAFNPVVPPAAITQVLLLANPHKEKVRLRFKLTFTMEEETFSEMGVVEQFPAAESWGSL
ncbi:UNVERIFIED_CONTAM: hypothetical protein FKN15_022716 [Acipenser sinensis]